MNNSIKVSNLFLMLCFYLLIIHSSMIHAENDKPEKNSQKISDAETIITNYAGKDSSNQFKNNMDTLDNYYEEINKKLHNNFPEIESSEGILGDGSTKSVKKPLIDSINVGDVSELEDGNNETFTVDKTVNDQQLLDLMKSAGVDNKKQTSNKNEDQKPTIRVYRDPFSLTRTLTGGGRLIEDSLPFAHKTFAEKMPKMVLKGVVKKPDGTRVALLELDDKVTYMVKENDRVGLSAIGLRMVIHIQEIHENTIIIEPGEINAGQESEVIVVR